MGSNSLKFPEVLYFAVAIRHAVDLKGGGHCDPSWLNIPLANLRIKIQLVLKFA